LAAERGKSDEVKKLGERMATDHQKAYDELNQIASKTKPASHPSPAVTPRRSTTGCEIRGWAAKTLPTIQEQRTMEKDTSSHIRSAGKERGRGPSAPPGSTTKSE